MLKQSFLRDGTRAIVGRLSMVYQWKAHHVSVIGDEQQQARRARLLLRGLRRAQQRAQGRLGHRLPHERRLPPRHRPFVGRRFATGRRRQARAGQGPQRRGAHPQGHAGPHRAGKQPPVTRTLWGRDWSFAHNGDLKDYAPAAGPFQPAGDTDSERAFCHLMSGLLQRFPHGAPPRSELVAALAGLAATIAAHGTFNFILSDGELLFAHCSTQLHYLIREYPFPVAQLVDCELDIDFSRHNHLDDRIAIIATAPLTRNEAWTALPPGRLAMFSGGRAVDAAAPRRPTLIMAI